ncbi:MAG: histidine phosphatase family protein [Deltaproteobacteria bacterium]|jgi:broad specificity phosphatase PhoE|nr:histidine phosphatase family protein [Deltaproteobacteria bacterium]
MLELLLIRHGQTDWNAQHLVMGRKPIPLNEIGLKQAEGLSQYLKNTDLRAIISSPVKRAHQTAEIVGRCHDGIAIQTDDGLAEIDYGDWIGRSFDDIESENGELWREYHEDPTNVALPGGERMADVSMRVAKMLKDIRLRYEDGRVALVSHADVIKVALLNLMDLDIKRITNFSVDNCALILVRFHPVIGPRLIAYNAMNGFGHDL